MGYLKNELTGFVPVEQATDIIKMVTRGSSVLRMAKVEEMKHEKKKKNKCRTQAAWCPVKDI